GPNHDLSWHNVDHEFNKFAIEQLRETGLILFGRRTYQLMESFWPKAAVDPGTSPDNREIARLINNTEKIVFSRTLDSVRETENWKDVKLRRKVDPVEIKRLKEMPGKDIWVGTSDLALSFIKEDLIDEFRFMINPIVVGGGKRAQTLVAASILSMSRVPYHSWSLLSLTAHPLPSTPSTGELDHSPMNLLK